MGVKGIRFGVYIPEDLGRELEVCMRRLGIGSKSRVVQEALRLFIAEHRWRLSGSVVGAIGVVYSHGVGHADEELTDIQHNYLDVILSSLHVHLDKENCMLIIVVRGDSGRLKSLLESISRVRGVKVARPLLLSH